MQFIYPAFLFALSALAIPILIHLFNFRKFKRIYFTNVRFLKEIKQETQSKSRLKHLLVLISRLLAIAFLVFAFAQPYIPVGNSVAVSGTKLVSIYIDNSFSMEAQGKNGNLLEQAKKNAREIAASFAPSDRFQLLTNDFEGKHQRLLTREAFLTELQEVKISPSVKSVQEIISRQSDALNTPSTGSKSIFLISDFQQGSFEFEKVRNDTSSKVILIPLEGATSNNVYIDTCWFDSPARQLNRPEALHVRINNASAQAVENAPIKLFINNQQKALASFSIEPNSSTEVELSFTCKESGHQQAKLQINDYPISFDDSYFFSFEIAKKIAVLSINQDQENSAIQNLFKNDSSFYLQQVNEKSIDYSALSKNNLIVLNELQTISSGLAQELNRFINNGGSLVLFPGIDIDMPSYRNFLSSLNSIYFTQLDTSKSRVDKINRLHPIYNDVFDKSKRIPESIDLPVVLAHYGFNQNARTAVEYLMKLQNGDLFLSKIDYGKGQIYLCAVPLNVDFSNFTKHAMFVPTLYKIALFSIRQQKLFYTIGNNEQVLLGTTQLGADEVFHLKNTRGDFDLVPEHKVNESGTNLILHDQLKLADNYMLYRGKDSLLAVSFNYDRKESMLRFFTTSELESRLSASGFENFSILSGSTKELGTALTELNQGKRYWKLCILLALFFLACEAALLRFLK